MLVRVKPSLLCAALDRARPGASNLLSTEAAGRRAPAQRAWLGRLDLQKSDERRLVLLVEQHDVEHTEASTPTEEQLVADLDSVGIVASPMSSPSGV